MMFPAPPTSAAELDLLADALGDPTRRAVFKYVAESPDAVTAADVGVTFGIHRTVARAHLERLVESGLLDAEFRHRSEGGRPPKVYRRSERRLDLQLPARQYELLAELLLSTLERFGEAAETMVRQAGYEFGRQWAESIGATTPAELLAPLHEAGAELSTDALDARLQVTTRTCLFREVAARRPRLVCMLDRAVTEGLLSRAAPPYTMSASQRRNDDHDSCVHVFEMRGHDEPLTASRLSTLETDGNGMDPATEDAR